MDPVPWSQIKYVAIPVLKKKKKFSLPLSSTLLLVNNSFNFPVHSLRLDCDWHTIQYNRNEKDGEYQRKIICAQLVLKSVLRKLMEITC
jgi:hypothetical protein